MVDEQHRFGVEQRQALSERAAAAAGPGGAAHLLYMTATPIPRTLALTAYGDLTVSTIRGRPPGRAPVETRWVREADREQAYELVRAQLRAGHQAYVICPLVEEGEAAEARAATSEAERLRAGPFADFSVGLAHGAQRSDEKRAAMAGFASGRTDLLVATTVVEVGIDVPNATDDRRGGRRPVRPRPAPPAARAGSGAATDPGLCLLFGEPATEEGARRLEALTQTATASAWPSSTSRSAARAASSGVRQAGATDLRVARLGRDRRELAEARHIARRTLALDPRLERPEHSLLRDAVLARFDALPRLLDA